MKRMQNTILFLCLLTGYSALSADPPTGSITNASSTSIATNASAAETPSGQPQLIPSENGTASQASNAKSDGDTNSLHLNFRAASLDMVLNYFSEAAGYIINIKPGTSVRGKVDVWSSEPLTREEALNLLDTVLIQNGLAAIRNGKTLTIVNRDEAKTQNVPVMTNSNPADIPISDKIVTQIIPVRFVEVAQLTKDLQPLVSLQTSMTANEAGNAIIITDTQANIRKVAEIIRAIDLGAEDFTELRVFKLVNADPTETADLLTNLFPDDSRTGNSQSPFAGGGGGFRRMLFGGGGGGGGGFGNQGGGGNGSNNQNQRIKKRNRVIAVADQRTAAVVVSANRDLMEQIADVVTGLDGDPKGKPGVTVIHTKVADPQELLSILQETFPSTTTTGNRNTASQTSPLMTRGSSQSQQGTSSSTRSSSMTPSTGGGRGSVGSFGQ